MPSDNASAGLLDKNTGKTTILSNGTPAASSGRQSVIVMNPKTGEIVPPSVQQPGIRIGPRQSFKRGGGVKETGVALLHKGERVLTKKQNKRYTKRSSGRSAGR
jgi:hypothetical protein